jgi:hypothetical protein
MRGEPRPPFLNSRGRAGRAHPRDAYESDAFVSVRYRDYWFWIDERALYSKRTFSFLMYLFMLTETGGVQAAPVVTVPRIEEQPACGCNGEGRCGMMSSRKGLLYRPWDIERGPYLLLVVTVFTVFVTSPLVVIGVFNPLVLDAFFAVFMFVGAMTVHPRHGLRYLVLILAALAVLIRMASKLFPGTAIQVSEAVFEVTAIGFFAALVLKQFLISGRTAPHRIVAAVVVYLLVGIIWSRFYEITGLLIPGAFHMGDSSATLTSYTYFSFVTLATIGYGDIYPVHPVARNLAVLEAITGQMYIAVLIARLVSTSPPGEGRQTKPASKPTAGEGEHA